MNGIIPEGVGPYQKRDFIRRYRVDVRVHSPIGLAVVVEHPVVGIAPALAGLPDDVVRFFERLVDLLEPGEDRLLRPELLAGDERRQPRVAHVEHRIILARIDGDLEHPDLGRHLLGRRREWGRTTATLIESVSNAIFEGYFGL
jgi:hypothetical protein